MTDYPTKVHENVWVCALVVPDAEFPTVPDAFLAGTDFEPLKQTDPMSFDEKAATIPVAMEFVNRGPGLWSFVGTVIAREIPNLGTEWRLGEGSFTRVTRDRAVGNAGYVPKAAYDEAIELLSAALGYVETVAQGRDGDETLIAEIKNRIGNRAA